MGAAGSQGQALPGWAESQVLEVQITQIPSVGCLAFTFPCSPHRALWRKHAWGDAAIPPSFPRFTDWVYFKRGLRVLKQLRLLFSVFRRFFSQTVEFLTQHEHSSWALNLLQGPWKFVKCITTCPQSSQAVSVFLAEVRENNYAEFERQ